MFKLSKQEFEDLRFQFGTFKTATKGRKYLPHVFTEYGIVALSGILNSEVATKVNISIVRTFIKMRRSLYAFSINNVMHTVNRQHIWDTHAFSCPNASSLFDDRSCTVFFS